MKKLMTLMLGMSLVLGSAALVFGQDTTTKTTESTAKTAKKSGKKKVVKKTETTEKKS
jgi:hypothetical protein